MTESVPAARTARRIVVLALAGLAASGCGGDFTAVDQGLDDAEAAELATVMAAQAGRVLAAQVEKAPRPDLDVEISSQLLFDRGSVCSRGGSASVTGRVTRESARDDDRMTLDFRASLVHDSCAVGVGNRTVTLTGAPAVGLEALFERRGLEFEGPQEASLEGQIRWSAADGAGSTCEVDLTTTLTEDGTSLTAAGRMCGVEIDRTTRAPPSLDVRPGRDEGAGTDSS